MHNLADSNPAAGCIEYHAWWPSGADPFYLYNTPENTGRIQFYGVNGTPTIRIDGKYPGSAGNLVTFVNNRFNDPSNASIDVSGSYDSGTRMGSIAVTMTSDADLPADSYVVRAALIESDIYYNTAYNDMHYNIMRDMLPTHTGTPVVFAAGGSTEQVNLNFTLPTGVPPNGGIVEENAELVVWLQPLNFISPVYAKVINCARVAVLALDATGVSEMATRFFDLKPAYPNPFNPNTKIPVQVDESGSALLQIIDVNGRVISELHNGVLSAGAHEFTWNGTDVNGDIVASGVYMAKLTGATESHSQRLVMLK